MKIAGLTIPVLAAALLLAGGLRAQDLAMADKPAASDKPYTGITTRNVFGLVPIPVVDPATLNQPPPDPPPKITPNGIMTIFGKLQVLFKVATRPPPGQPQKDDSYVMTEGERQDDIEVVKIDGKAGLVTFNNHGTIQELALVPVTNPGSPAGPVGTPRLPVPGFGRPSAPVGGMATPVMPAMGSDNAVGPGGRRVQMGGNRGVNQMGGNSSTPGLGSNPQLPEGMSPEAQIIMLEANRVATQEAVNKGFLPPLPITPLTPSDATGNGGLPIRGARN